MHLFHVSKISRATASNWACHSRRIRFSWFLARYSVSFIFAALLVSFTAAPLPFVPTAPRFALQLLELLAPPPPLALAVALGRAFRRCGGGGKLG